MRLLLAASIAVVGVSAPLGAASPVEAKDPRVWSSAEKARPQQLRLLEQLVNIDSGTGDVEGGRRVAAVVSQRLKALGMSG